jgi:DNA-binding HxlR family transcriptional regulator
MTSRHKEVTALRAPRASLKTRAKAPADPAEQIEQRLREGDHEGVAHDCKPAAEILARVGDKWSVLIVMLLGNGPKRFNEMRKLIGGISQRMLTLTLKGLERDGLLTRTVTPTNPPRVDYALTQLGHSLREPITALGQWAFANRAQVLEARERFDRSNALTR